MKKLLLFIALCLASFGFGYGASALLQASGVLVFEQHLADKVEQVIPSVVHVRHSSGWQGSGVIISSTDSDGLILTARHVIETYGTYTVTLNDGRQYRSNEACVSKKYDVGFIKINAENLPVSQIGNSADLRIGEQVFTIGSPLGYDNFNSVTLGILSAKERSGPVGWGWTVMLQTDTSVYPGNSGSPLFNMQGDIVGIVVGGYVPSLIYCIPIEQAEDLIESVKLLFALERVDYVEEPEEVYEPYEEEWSLIGPGLGE